MQVTYTVYLNGTEKTVTFDKPAGSLPDSLATALVCIRLAEAYGGVVTRIRRVGNKAWLTRDDAVRQSALYCPANLLDS